jgi:hypothetical protein
MSTNLLQHWTRSSLVRNPQGNLTLFAFAALEVRDPTSQLTPSTPDLQIVCDAHKAP